MKKNLSLNWDAVKNLTDIYGLKVDLSSEAKTSKHYYKTIENALALQFTSYYYYLSKDKEILSYHDKFLNYIHLAYSQDTHRFKTGSNRSNQFDTDEHSEEVLGQVFWSIGASNIYGPKTYKSLYENLLNKISINCNNLTNINAISTTLLGLHHLYNANHEEEVKQRIHLLSSNLAKTVIKQVDSLEWPWYENNLNSQSSLIIRALLTSAFVLKNKTLLIQTQKLLNWLISLQYRQNHVSLIDHFQGLEKGNPIQNVSENSFDTYLFLETCCDAELRFKNNTYIKFAKASLEWFFGKNKARQSVVIDTTGQAYEGLIGNTLNQNISSKSTLSWLLASCKYELTVLYQKKKN